MCIISFQTISAYYFRRREKNFQTFKEIKFAGGRKENETKRKGWVKGGVFRSSLDEKKRQKAYDTRYSQAVSHPSTNRARCCLTSVIGREPVYSAWYGRRRKMTGFERTYRHS